MAAGSSSGWGSKSQQFSEMIAFWAASGTVIYDMSVHEVDFLSKSGNGSISWQQRAEPPNMGDRLAAGPFRRGAQRDRVPPTSASSSTFDPAQMASR
jgi:hypothetical protein